LSSDAISGLLRACFGEAPFGAKVMRLGAGWTVRFLMESKYDVVLAVGLVESFLPAVLPYEALLLGKSRFRHDIVYSNWEFECLLQKPALR
jgi:hypothetical protein